MSDISIRTIEKTNDATNEIIKGCKFIVKDYQRGYRWDETQISALLDDINAFKTDNDTLKYCLQPLVVKSTEEIVDNKNCLGERLKQEVCLINNNIWELIDGQQRLTTILLIIKVCYADRRTPPPLPFDIVYVNEREIDAYYIEEAEKAINNWFKNAEEEDSDIKFKITSKINKSIQFIWYEVDSDANSANVFTKLNMGKIPLTNAELFKAILLNFSNEKGSSGKVTFEWDMIEQSLHNDEFWLFISNSNLDKETRIDYLLKLFAFSHKKQIGKINSEDRLFPFLAANELIKKGVYNADEIWQEIVKIHNNFKEWYEETLKYHKIGFLIATTDKPTELINELMELTLKKRKSKFLDFVQEKIKEKFKQWVVLEDLDYDKSTDKKIIRNLLLLFNLSTMIKSKTNSRFSFKEYKEGSWDLEHVHARATEEYLLSASEAEKAELLNGLEEQLKLINDQNSINKINEFRQSGSADNNDFLELYNQINDNYGTFYGNNIGNLVLLDSETNREYKNSLFSFKRQRIIERDKGEVFIPVCTKNVFLKMYSVKGLDNMSQWNSDDAQDYLNEMYKILSEEINVCLSAKK